MAAVPFPGSNWLLFLARSSSTESKMALAEARKPELAAWLVTVLGVCNGSGPVGAFLPDPARGPDADTQRDEPNHQSEEKLLRTTGAQQLLQQAQLSQQLPGRGSDEPFAPSPVAKSGFV